MIGIVYVSSAPRLLTPETLDSILAESRRNNERSGITGMLLYADGNFIQAIEGPEEAIDSLLNRLRGDPRHRNLTIIARYPIEDRQFPNWSMGFRRLDSSRPSELADAFTDLRDPEFNLEDAAPNSIAHRLLDGFRDRNRA